MNKKFRIVTLKIKTAVFVFGLIAVLAPLAAFAQFDKAEFAARRAKFFEKIGSDVAVLIGNEEHPHAVKFRQQPDFYYLTGIEEPNAILVMSGKDKQAVVFLPKRSPMKVYVEGPGVLDMPKPEEYYGVAKIQSLEQFAPFLSKEISQVKKIYAPLTPPDQLQFAREELIGELTEASRLPFAEKPDFMRAVARIKELQPTAEVADVSPLMNDLRWIKTPYEIERMRKAGAIGAEGVKEAMKGTKPGMYEYELEALARFVYVKRGARGDAFMPIVASGPNTMTLHYVANNRQMQAGDVVYMDYGADFDYYTSDITRTWAVSGKFTPEQEKMYRCILEARAAIIGVMKPGASVADMKNAAHAVYKKHGFEKEFLQFGRYVGHFVGMSVHDVGDDDKPFVAGVTYNVEPLIQNNEQKIHMRLEDTVLITAKGAENLTAGVPAELEEVYALGRQTPLGANLK